MSVIEIKTHPITHIIVRDFLDSSSKKKLLNSLLPIRENHLKRLPPRGDLKEDAPGYKPNHFKKALWIQNILEEYPVLNRDCIDVLESNMWRDDLQQAYEDTNDLLFSIHSLFSTNSSILFSQYETGGWMTWHTDPIPVCSASYIFKFDDRDCLEGDFLLSELLKTDKKPLQENIVSYPFEDNFLIIFPSKALHRVTKVRGYRYSLQYFTEGPGWENLTSRNVVMENE
jgi:hypothetical protein